MKGLLIGLLLFALLGVMFASQTLYYDHQEDNITDFDIYNFTENNLNWNYTPNEFLLKNNNSQSTNFQSRRISNLVNKFIDWIGYSIFEIGKWGVEFGYTHPQYEFNYFMNLVKYWMYIMVAIMISPILIPLIALIYLLYNFVQKMRKKMRMRHEQ